MFKHSTLDITLRKLLSVVVIATRVESSCQQASSQPKHDVCSALLVIKKIIASAQPYVSSTVCLSILQFIHKLNIQYKHLADVSDTIINTISNSQNGSASSEHPFYLSYRQGLFFKNNLEKKMHSLKFAIACKSLLYIVSPLLVCIYQIDMYYPSP